MDSSLSIAIDAHRHDAPLKLVLSGSYVDLMEHLVDADSPLYGRFTHIINLQPFDYRTASLFYPACEPADKVLMYSAFGGVPYFNSLVDPSRPAIDNVLDLVVGKESILEHEVSEMLLAETNRVAGLNTVIELVGGGVTKYGDIAARLSRDGEARPAYALSRLQGMGILRKVEPINAKGNRKRKQRRRLLAAADDDDDGDDDDDDDGGGGGGGGACLRLQMTVTPPDGGCRCQ